MDAGGCAAESPAKSSNGEGFYVLQGHNRVRYALSENFHRLRANFFWCAGLPAPRTAAVLPQFSWARQASPGLTVHCRVGKAPHSKKVHATLGTRVVSEGAVRRSFK
jgi:hypothetical protein